MRPPGNLLSCQIALIREGPLIHPVILLSLTAFPRWRATLTVHFVACEPMMPRRMNARTKYTRRRPRRKEESIGEIMVAEVVRGWPLYLGYADRIYTGIWNAQGTQAMDYVKNQFENDRSVRTERNGRIEQQQEKTVKLPTRSCPRYILRPMNILHLRQYHNTILGIVSTTAYSQNNTSYSESQHTCAKHSWEDDIQTVVKIHREL